MAWDRRLMQVCAALGIAISLYALHVEREAGRNPMYVAGCDISEWVSCTKVFSSTYGHMLAWAFGKGHVLDVPNAALGLLFYTMVLLHATFLWKHARGLVVVAATGSVAMSVYLGYVLYAILHEVCVVCVSSYVLNATIWLLSIRAFLAQPIQANKRNAPRTASQSNKKNA